MTNQAGGYIYLTLTSCVYPGTNTPLPGSYYFYSTNNGGGIVWQGCYTFKSPFYYATYSDGSKYIWNANAFYNLGR